MKIMVDREQVLEALKPLQEPRFRQSLVELNLIRDILVRDSRVNLSVVLSESDEAFRSGLQAQIEQILKKLGAEDVHIRFRQITDFEQAKIERSSRTGNDRPGNANASGMDEMQQRRQAEMSAGGMPPLLAPGSKTQFIAVASGKGGVGKSTVTVNLAAALARKGRKVGIMDADIYGFSVPDMMGIEELPVTENNAIIPVEKFGVKVISMGFFVQDNAPVIWRGPMLGKMLRNFFNEISWGEIDYMLLDLPPGTGDIALDVHQMIPHSKEILVTTPHATASFVAARAGAMATQTHHEILGVVENMAYYQCSHCGNKDYVFGRGGGAKLAEELRTDLLGQIPLQAPDNHPSEADYSPAVYKADSDIGRIYTGMAEAVIAKIEKN